MIDGKGFRKVDFFVAKRDQVGFGFTRSPVVYPVNRLEAGVGYLCGVVRNFYFRNEFAVFFDRREFVNSAERRHIRARYEFSAYAPTVYFRALLFKALYKSFVEIARRAYNRIWITRVVEHFSRPLRSVCEIARIYTYSERFFAFRFEFVKDLYRVGNTAF